MPAAAGGSFQTSDRTPRCRRRSSAEPPPLLETHPEFWMEFELAGFAWDGYFTPLSDSERPFGAEMCQGWLSWGWIESADWA